MNQTDNVFIEAIVIDKFSENCYILSRAGENYIIDPGDEAELILSRLASLNYKLDGILLTHGHFDHLLALPALKEATGAKIYIHAGDVRFLTDPYYSLLPAFIINKMPPPDIIMDDGYIIGRGSPEIRVIHTPGHTPGSCCFSCGDYLFTGDTYFAPDIYGCTEFPGGDEDILLESIEKISHLISSKNILPGHSY